MRGIVAAVIAVMVIAGSAQAQPYGCTVQAVRPGPSACPTCTNAALFIVPGGSTWDVISAMALVHGTGGFPFLLVQDRADWGGAMLARAVIQTPLYGNYRVTWAQGLMPTGLWSGSWIDGTLPSNLRLGPLQQLSVRFTDGGAWDTTLDAALQVRACLLQ